MEKAKNVEIIKFGSFEKKDIEWIVLAKKEENGKKIALLLSKYVIAAEAFQKDGENVNWSNSSIREWLNNNFYTKAFSSEKDEIIQKSTIISHEHPSSSIFQGINKEDKIFLLSVKEVEDKEFQNYRLCSYLENLKNRCFVKDGYCRWILRTIGKEHRKVVCVNCDGEIDYDGCDIDVQEGIRPAMWVDLSKMREMGFLVE